MAQATATFEAGSNGATILTTDTGAATAWDSTSFAGGNVATYDNTHAYGPLAAKINNTANNAVDCTLIWTTGIGTLTDHYGRIYLYATAFPAAGSYRLISDLNGNFPIFIKADGTVAMIDQGGFAVTTTTPIALNQWVRIEYHWLNSATVGQVEIKLFNSPDSSAATETQTSAANRNTSVSTTQLNIGLANGGTASGPIWVDNIVAGATSYPGPVAIFSQVMRAPPPTVWTVA